VRWLDDTPRGFAGKTRRLEIPFTPEEWRVDPKSSIGVWVHPTLCLMHEVLSGISRVEVAGDFTLGKETIAIDEFGWDRGLLLPSSCKRTQEANQ